MREISVEHVHSPCLSFRELTVPWLLNGATIERIACVTQSTELDGDAENGLELFCCAFGCSKYDKHRKDGVSFHRFRGTRNFDDVCWVTALRLQSLPETAKICRKNTMVNERSIDGAKKRKWRKTKDFHSLFAGGDT